jgi:urea transporter
MIDRLKILFPSFISSILNSYTQIFFSNNKLFALILVLVTFFDVYAGMSGLLAVIISNILAFLIGFNRNNIKAGHYGFNSLLVGLGIGIFYQPGLELYVLLFFTAFLTLFITIMMEGVIGKYGLPFLSLSFLFSIWLVTLASRQFTHLTVSERGIYNLNEMYTLGGASMVKVYNWFNLLPWHDAVKLYFKSLGAILFQYHLFPGILVAIGLLIYSRISFILSLLGFFSAYYYYHFIGANFNELSYGYIGFNFILTSIAIGGFFVIPSRLSYLWVILLTPLISIFLTSFSVIFSLFQLSIFSLPFNIVVLLFLYILKFRERFYSNPQLVTFQEYSPEKNLYSFINYKQRFGKSHLLDFSLPFRGTWKVTQGHDGKPTHQGDWRHAWDFEIADDQNLTYSGEGRTREDYFCFNKPVIAPADGWVEEFVDDVDENEIGEINVDQNWGNSIVLRHTDFLYSKLSHLKKQSIKVAQGDHVKKGDLLAVCGNSGRSPVPHLHFQIQSTPFIGSKTKAYPIGHFMVNEKGNYSLKTFQVPEINTKVSNIEKNEVLVKAFHLIPGQKAKFMVYDSLGEEYKVNWEVLADFGNKTFLYCERTGSKAYYLFANDELQFTHFEGDRSSLLFYYYLGAFRVSTGFYKGLELTDAYPLTIINNRILLFFQDFIAPFYLFMKTDFSLRYIKMEDHFTHSRVWLKAKTSMKIGKKEIRKIEIEFEATKSGMERIVIMEKKRRMEAIRIEE